MEACGIMENTSNLVGRYIEEATMSTLNVTNPTKGAAKVLSWHPASEHRTPRARATHIADAIAPDSTRRVAVPSSRVQKQKAGRPPKAMREILDESAEIYSKFCKSRS
jgi:hypothetical protein